MFYSLTHSTHIDHFIKEEEQSRAMFLECT